MDTHTGYMLDTNVFNHVLDGAIDIDKLKGKRLFATHIQRDEINNTKDESRRVALLSVFEFLTKEQGTTSSAAAGISVAGGARAGVDGVVPTESAVSDVSRWDEAQWGREDDIFEGMRRELDALNRAKRSNVHDILIAETSLRSEWVLITGDADLFAVVTKYGGACGNVFMLQAV